MTSDLLAERLKVAIEAAKLPLTIKDCGEKWSPWKKSGKSSHWWVYFEEA